MHLYLLSKG